MIFAHSFFFFQAEDGIRDLVRSRGLGDVYKRQGLRHRHRARRGNDRLRARRRHPDPRGVDDRRGSAAEPALSLIHI